MARDRARRPEAVRITTAAPSPQDELAGRQRRYVLSMGIRTLCFIGAILASVAGLNWLWPILIVAALVLPYVAVVMANARHTRGDDFRPATGGVARPELGARDTPPRHAQN